MRSIAASDCIFTHLSKLLFSLCIFVQFGMDSAYGQSLFSLNPSLSPEEITEIKAVARKSTFQVDEIEPIPIKADISVLNLDFITFPVPDGPTYYFSKTRANEQGGKFGWYGETQDGKVQAAFRRFADGSLHANVYVAGPPDGPRLEAHYSADASASGIGLFRRLSLTTENFPRHPPGKRTQHMRPPASCPAASTTAGASAQIDVLVLHTADAARTAGGRLAADVRTAIDHCNAGAINSRVPDLKFKLVGPAVSGTAVGPQLVGYEENRSNESALNWLAADDNEDVKQLRNLYRADVVVLVVGNQADGCGIANSYAHSEKAFAVVYAGDQCLTNKYYSIAHEIGHIIGLDHDTENLEGDPPFPYGRGAHITSPCVHTIMAYDMPCPGSTSRTSAEAVFSFPGNYYSTSSASLGDANADNRRVLSCQFAEVATFRN